MIDSRYLKILDTPIERWGVLCIDAWDNDGYHDDFYNDCVRHLKNFNVAKVVNATTSIKLDYTDRSVYNTLHYYLWSHYRKQVDKRDLHQALLEMVLSAGRNRTSRVLNSNLFDSNTVHITSLSVFLQHCQIFCKDIRHWIILGMTWNVCTHRSNMGLNQLINDPNHNFHVFDWSILKNDYGLTISRQDIEEDYLTWTENRMQGYMLIGQQ